MEAKKKPLLVALILFLLGIIPIKAQNSNYDLGVYYLLTPTNCAKLDQAVIFYPYNLGMRTINSFEARVYKNDELLFTEQVNVKIPSNDYKEVRLHDTVHFEYGEEAVVSLRIVAPNDENEENDSVSMAIKMPVEMDYPFTWTSENAKKYFHDSGLGTLDWQWDDNYEAYYMSDRVTNWMGTLITEALPFPENEPVRCSLDFGTSGGDVTLYVMKDYGDNVVETDTVLLGHSTEDFTSTYFSFLAKGPAILRMSATLGGDWNASGSIYIKNICFSQAGKDLMTKSILLPSGEAVAVGDDENVIKARFYNPSPCDIVDPMFCYRTGDVEVSEKYEGTIKPGATIDYIFQKTYKYSSPCVQTLKVWCEAEGDSEPGNNSIEREITYYEPLAFPYITTFDEDNNLWTIVDRNADDQTFEFLPMANDDMAAAFTNYSASDIDEVLLSPAIKIPAGKHRVNFNFAGYTQNGSVNLKLFIGKTPDVTKMTEVLFDHDLRSQYWQTGYHLLDIPADGTYYFAFVAKGSSDAVVIDNFKVDDGEDLGITDLRFGTEDGYNLTTTTVTISYANYGITPQKDVQLAYFLNNGDGYTEEINPTTINPGDTISYTFNQLADISEIGMTYQAVGMLLSSTGDEDINDMAYSYPITNQAPQQTPYYIDFQDEARTAQWKLTTTANDGLTGWSTTYGINSYSTMGILKHDNWSGKKADSWAYSEGIELEKGTYEVSYFHHEAFWFSGTAYQQTFDVNLGKERTPEGMTIKVDEQKKVDIVDPQYKKIVKRVEIPEKGIYFLGFHNTSPGNNGYTLIDDVRIEAVEDGLELPYESDFASADTLNWTLYDLNPYNFLQWEVEDGKFVADRTEDDSWTYPEGMLVSPKIHIDANRKAIVKVGYSISGDVKIDMYKGIVNDNSALNKVTSLKADKTSYEYEIESSEDPQDIYFGFRSNNPINGTANYEDGPFYTISLDSLKVTYDEQDGISQVESGEWKNENGKYIENGRVVIIKNGKKYTTSGQRL